MPVVEIDRRQDPAAVDRILRSLPDWFAIGEAVVNYVESAWRRDSFLAIIDGEVVGVALVNRQFRIRSDFVARPDSDMCPLSRLTNR